MCFEVKWRRVWVLRNEFHVEWERSSLKFLVLELNLPCEVVRSTWSLKMAVFLSHTSSPFNLQMLMAQMRLHRSKFQVYIHVGRWRVAQESLENQFRTLGLILGHFPSPPLMPKFGTQLGGPITLDFHIGLRWKLKDKLLRHKKRDTP